QLWVLASSADTQVTPFGFARVLNLVHSSDGGNSFDRFALAGGADQLLLAPALALTDGGHLELVAYAGASGGRALLERLQASDGRRRSHLRVDLDDISAGIQWAGEAVFRDRERTNRNHRAAGSRVAREFRGRVGAAEIRERPPVVLVHRVRGVARRIDVERERV